MRIFAKMMFAQVILPLAVNGTFTYRVPDSLMPAIGVGRRVVVPIGAKKTYVGIVSELHSEVPQGIKTKDIVEVLDQTPCITERQMELWRWMADYYMSPIGDVYRAAVPALLKDDGKYRERTQRTVVLGREADEATLQQWVNALTRAPQQQELFLRYLDMSDYGRNGVAQRALLEATGATSSPLTALVKKGILRLEDEAVSRLPHYKQQRPPHPLSEAQQTAYEQIRSLWNKKEVVYLHGVTASGKTEIYTQLIADTLATGRQVLYLVPEIALTTQLTDRLAAVFGDQMLVYHSKFSDEERVELYLRLLNGEAKLILGARSTVLLPFRDVGLVIVDEEHEQSYRQQDPAPRYQGRNTALMLAHLHGAKALLGSATPSIDMYHNARQGRYGLVELHTRYRDVRLPLLKVVDMREAYKRKEYTGHISDALRDEISTTLSMGQQVILFQNRRGYAPYAQCKACGESPKCPHCDVSLTVHKRQGQLVCHYCGYRINMPDTCPSCQAPAMTYLGLGTERVEDEIEALFPTARLQRMDLDTTRAKDGYQRIIRSFQKGEIDILIGTQMVTKGLDFEHVRLVGILNADSLFTMPNFRANEQAYQLLEQVSGRAGRAGQRGTVVLQTSQPGHQVISWLAHHDYERLYQTEIEERQAVHYPPFYRFINIMIRHRDYHSLEAAAQLLQQNLQASFGTRCSNVITPAISRVQELYMRQLLLRIEPQANVQEAKKLLQQHLDWLLSQKEYTTLRLHVEVE